MKRISAIIILGLITGCVTTDLYTPPPQSTSKSSGLPSDLPPIFKLGLQDSEKELQNIDDFFDDIFIKGISPNELEGNVYSTKRSRYLVSQTNPLVVSRGGNNMAWEKRCFNVFTSQNEGSYLIGQKFSQYLEYVTIEEFPISNSDGSSGSRNMAIFVTADYSMEQLTADLGPIERDTFEEMLNSLE